MLFVWGILRRADRLGVGHVVLLALSDSHRRAGSVAPHGRDPRSPARYDERWREPRSPQGSELARKKRENLFAPELLAEHDHANSARAMRLENALRQIQPDCANFHHGHFPSSGSQTPRL